LFLDCHRVFRSSSPDYGSPGVFLVSCHSVTLTASVFLPVTGSSGHPVPTVAVLESSWLVVTESFSLLHASGSSDFQVDDLRLPGLVGLTFSLPFVSSLSTESRFDPRAQLQGQVHDCFPDGHRSQGLQVIQSRLSQSWSLPGWSSQSLKLESHEVIQLRLWQRWSLPRQLSRKLAVSLHFDCF
jgi:hypothetical protein